MATKVASCGVALVMVAGAVFLGYHYVMSSILSSNCGNRILKEVPSPDGAYVATLFERNCGATTPYYQVASLRSADSKFDPEMKDDWIVQVEQQPDILLKWG